MLVILHQSKMLDPAMTNSEKNRYLLKKGEVASQLYANRPIEVISEWIIKDEAISGRSAHREGYQIITEALRNKNCPFQIIVVDDLSRLNRDLGNSLHFYQLVV